MPGPTISAGDIDRSVVIVGSGNSVSLRFGADGPVLPLSRKQVGLPDRRRFQRGDERRCELDILDPNRSQIPLIGRDDLLADLDRWLTSEADISVHCLSGRAGTGKTRLAIELCRQIDGAPEPGSAWVAGFLSPVEIRASANALATKDYDWSTSTLLVIDYAAQAHVAIGQWLDRLALQELTVKLRILLLEREAPAGPGWWESLTGSARNSAAGRLDLFRDADLRPEALPGLHQMSERRAVVTAAFEAAQALYGAIEAGIPKPGTDDEFDALLDEERFANPLSLVMAGVIAVDKGARAALALRRLDAARHLARRELQRVGDLAGSGQDWAVRHLVAFNGLAGGLPVAGLNRTLAAELGAMDLAGDVGALAELLQQELPPPVTRDGGAEARLGTIQPDLIGEGAIVEAFEAAPPAIRETGAATVRRAYERAGREAAEALMRLLQDYAYALEDEAAAEADKATARELMGWLTELAEGIQRPQDLEPLAFALPAHTLVLREQALTLTQRLAEAWQALFATSDALEDAVGASVWLTNLATRRSALGRREEALAAAEEAVALYRRLADARPEAFLPELARSLTNLGTLLSALGRREESLAAAEEAVALYRRLADARPEAFLPDLALSLNNLGHFLSGLGRREEALAAAEEAVALYSQLADARPEAFLPGLALSLNNLGNLLSDLGRREEALATAEEAVSLRRRLADARPEAFLPDLAMSLTNLASRLSNLDRGEEALATAEEAVRLYRRLAGARPEAFLPDLAFALKNLCALLGVLRREEALTVAEEAVALYRRLADARPEAFLPDLAGSLNNLGNALSALGRREDALAAAGEAVALYRRLADVRPATFAFDFSISLGALTNIHLANENPSDALKTTTEGTRVLTPVFLQAPQAAAQWMSMHLKRYLEICQTLNQQPDLELIGPLAETFQKIKYVETFQKIKDVETFQKIKEGVSSAVLRDSALPKGCIDINTSNKSILNRDKRARDAIQKYEEEGLPFVLFLRDFGWERFVGPREQYQAQHEPVYNTVTRTLPVGCGFVMVQNQDFSWGDFSIEHFLSPFRRRHDPAPGLLLDNNTWQEIVAWLIPRASLIICQLVAIRKGTEWELLRIISEGQRHKTLILLPGLGELGALLDAHPIVRMFPRCMYYDEIAESGSLAHFAAEDLQQRLITLVESRSATNDTPNDNPEACTPPIFYDPLIAKAYANVGYGLDIEANPNSPFKIEDSEAAAKAREIAFWSYVRSVVISEYIWATHPEQMTQRFIIELLDSYARIVEMCLKDFSAMKDPIDRLNLGNLCILNAVHLQSHCNVRLTDNRLENLAERYNAIRILAKLPSTQKGMLSSLDGTAEPQVQDSSSAPAGAKLTIIDKLKALFGMSTGRPR